MYGKERCSPTMWWLLRAFNNKTCSKTIWEQFFGHESLNLDHYASLVPFPSRRLWFLVVPFSDHVQTPPAIAGGNEMKWFLAVSRFAVVGALICLYFAEEKTFRSPECLVEDLPAAARFSYGWWQANGNRCWSWLLARQLCDEMKALAWKHVPLLWYVLCEHILN